MSKRIEYEVAVNNAARAVYARTPTGQRIQFDLLPGKVQAEMESIVRTVLDSALADLFPSAATKARERMERNPPA